MIEFIKMTCKKLRIGEKEQNITEIRLFAHVYETGLSQINIVCIGILSLLVVQANILFSYL